jgi:hypothetical protein
MVRHLIQAVSFPPLFMGVFGGISSSDFGVFLPHVCIPLSAATVVASILKLVQTMSMDILTTSVWLVFAGIAITVAALIAAGDVRRAMLRALARNFSRRL